MSFLEKWIWGVYNLSISMYGLGIKINALWSTKSKRWIEGRKAWQDGMSLIAKARNVGKKIIWIHCASLGEFEQARSLIELIHKNNSTHFIALSFFSPSGYEIQKNYGLAHWIGYLPLDTQKNAEKFIELLQPSICILIKYEFWHNMIRTLHNEQIPLVIAYSIFRKKHYLFKSFARPFLENIKRAFQIFVQDKNSLDLLQKLNFHNVTISGDGRIDRVLQIGSNDEVPSSIYAFCKGYRVFIAGSTWKKDIEVIYPAIWNLDDGWKVIIAPHQIVETEIQALLKRFGAQSTRYTLFNTKDSSSKVLILDTIGILSKIYSAASIAYVGGGFGRGIHNILEPMAAGIPVIFGPNYKKFREAEEIILSNGGFSIENAHDFEETLINLMHEKNLQLAKEATSEFLEKNKGASKVVYQFLHQKKLLD